MNYLYAFLLIAGTISNRSCQTETTYSAYIFDSRDSTLVYFANILVEDLYGNEIVRVTSGDEGRIFIPNLSKEFVLKVNHSGYVQRIDTVSKQSNRKNVEIYLTPK